MHLHFPLISMFFFSFANIRVNVGGMCHPKMALGVIILNKRLANLISLPSMCLHFKFIAIQLGVNKFNHPSGIVV
jgi:hypothetical protein